jgi:GGDEF domain-containing protein
MTETQAIIVAALILFGIVLHVTRRHRTARRDAVSGLATRDAFHEWLRAKLRLGGAQRPMVTVLVLQLYGIDRVRRRMGRRVSEKVEFDFATRLRQTVNPRDVCARLARGTFAVLLATDGAPGRARTIAGRLAGLTEVTTPDARKLPMYVNAAVVEGRREAETWAAIRAAAMRLRAERRSTFDRHEVERVRQAG